ncbi:MAG: SDR family NAD(P)-dependent oxidoreductase [Acetobacteraceae bacterium]
MDMFQGRTALVTGASSGIGAALARALAARGSNLVLVARRADRLEALAVECRARGVTVRVAPADLAEAEAREALARACPEVDLLVNNAGLGVYGALAETDWARTERLLAVNVIALTHLSRLFAPGMAARGFGRILQVASIVGFLPVPLFAAYAASKAYVVSLGLAMDAELAGSGVRVSVLCPGGTATEFFAVARGPGADARAPGRMMSAEAVAGVGLAALARGQGLAVAGGGNRAAVFALRFAPRGLVARLAMRVTRGR